MGNASDDVDKVKHSWAFNLPCMLLINGEESFWASRLKAIYEKLYKDILLTIRKTLAASLFEVVKLVDMKKKDNQTFFLEVVNHFLSDIDEIKNKVMPRLCEIVSCFPKDI